MFVDHRDFIFKAALKKIGNEVFITYQPVTEVEVPLQKGVVRGSIINSGFRFKEENGVTIVSQFTLVDPSGSLPAMVYNSVLENRSVFLIILKKCVTGEIKLQ